MAQVLSLGKLETNSYTNLLEQMNLRSNIADPKDPVGKGTRQFIYDYDPFHISIDFSYLPYVIVELPTLEYGMTVSNGKRKELNFKHRITVRTNRVHSGNRNIVDNGRIDMLNITDDMNQMFNSDAVRQVFRNNDMYKFNLTKISTDTYPVDGNYIYEALFELEYKAPLITTSS